MVIHDPMSHKSRGPIPLPPGDVPSETQCVSLCIPAGEHARRQLFGALYEFTHWNNYDRDPDHKGTLWAQAWRHAIMEGMLSCYQFRLHDGWPEFSNDGGETWAPVPANNDGQSGHDPRTDEPLKPARTGDNKACLAAANAAACFVELHREVSAWWAASAPILAFANAIIAVLSIFFPSFGFAWAATVAWLEIVNALLSHTSSLNEAAFTDDIRATLTCIFLKWADENGQWDETAFANVLDDVDLMVGDMWDVLHIYLQDIGGYIALNNAGTTTSVTSFDCGYCIEWCYDFIFTEVDLVVASEAEWPPATVLGDAAAHYLWTSLKPAQGFGYLQSHQPVGVQCEFDPVHCTTLTYAAQKTGTSTFGDARVYVKEEGGEWVIANYTILNTSVQIEVHRVIQGFAFIIYADRNHQLSQIRMKGLGDNPFGDNNC